MACQHFSIRGPNGHAQEVFKNDHYPLAKPVASTQNYSGTLSKVQERASNEFVRTIDGAVEISSPDHPDTVTRRMEFWSGKKLHSTITAVALVVVGIALAALLIAASQGAIVPIAIGVASAVIGLGGGVVAGMRASQAGAQVNHWKRVQQAPLQFADQRKQLAANVNKANSFDPVHRASHLFHPQEVKALFEVWSKAYFTRSYRSNEQILNFFKDSPINWVPQIYSDGTKPEWYESTRDAYTMLKGKAEDFRKGFEARLQGLSQDYERNSRDLDYKKQEFIRGVEAEGFQRLDHISQEERTSRVFSPREWQVNPEEKAREFAIRREEAERHTRDKKRSIESAFSSHFNKLFQWRAGEEKKMNNEYDRQFNQLFGDSIRKMVKVVTGDSTELPDSMPIWDEINMFQWNAFVLK